MKSAPGKAIACKRVAIVVLSLILSAAHGASLEQPVAAQEAEILALAELLPDPSRIHPDIAAQVAVDLSGIGPVAERLSAARSDLIGATGRSAQAYARIGSLDVEIDLMSIELLAERSEAATSAALLDAAEEDLGEFAVETFLGFEEIDLGALRLDGEVDPADTLAEHVGSLLTTTRDRAAFRHDAAAERVAELEAALTAIEDEIDGLTVTMREAGDEAAAAQELVDEYQPAFESALLEAHVEGTDFSVVVLDAYYRAHLTVAAERPSCEVRWDHLAGIGRVESRHGTYGGSSVAADGQTSGEILGPVLDGDPWQAIADTDGGRYDGDAVWDRAVGPMQFIPGSWARYGRDGNNDGETDPHNLYDAALAAAYHLCGTTGGLSARGNFQRALLGYNRSASYGLQVMEFSDQYLEAVGLVAGPESVA